MLDDSENRLHCFVDGQLYALDPLVRMQLCATGCYDPLSLAQGLRIGVGRFIVTRRSPGAPSRFFLATIVARVESEMSSAASDGA